MIHFSNWEIFAEARGGHDRFTSHHKTQFSLQNGLLYLITSYISLPGIAFIYNYHLSALVILSTINTNLSVWKRAEFFGIFTTTVHLKQALNEIFASDGVHSREFYGSATH